MKIDDDLKDMSLVQLRREVMRYRKAFEREASHKGNHRCWAMLEEARTGKIIRPIDIPEKEFLKNCKKYYQRNSRRIK